jgi:hypothetical protein
MSTSPLCVMGRLSSSSPLYKNPQVLLASTLALVLSVRRHSSLPLSSATHRRQDPEKLRPPPSLACPWLLHRLCKPPPSTPTFFRPQLVQTRVPSLYVVVFSQVPEPRRDFLYFCACSSSSLTWTACSSPSSLLRRARLRLFTVRRDLRPLVSDGYLRVCLGQAPSPRFPACCPSLVCLPGARPWTSDCRRSLPGLRLPVSASRARAATSPRPGARLCRQARLRQRSLPPPRAC